MLVDGHNRYNACLKLGIEPVAIEQEFESREVVINWMVENQLSRRNIDPNTRAYLIGKKYNLEKKPLGGAGCNSCNLKTNEKIAAEFNTSPRTVSNCSKYYEAVEKVCADGEISRHELISKTTMKNVTELAKMDDVERKDAIEKIKVGETPVTSSNGVFAICLKLNGETNTRLKKLAGKKSAQDYICMLIDSAWKSANNSGA